MYQNCDIMLESVIAVTFYPPSTTGPSVNRYPCHLTDMLPKQGMYMCILECGFPNSSFLVYPITFKKLCVMCQNCDNLTVYR